MIDKPSSPTRFNSTDVNPVLLFNKREEEVVVDLVDDLLNEFAHLEDEVEAQLQYEDEQLRASKCVVIEEFQVCRSEAESRVLESIKSKIDHITKISHRMNFFSNEVESFTVK